MNDKIQVVHFQRKPRPGANFSLEFIFEDVRRRLDGKVDFEIVVAKHFSNGILNRILNIIGAYSQQGMINHVTGDIHYINLLFTRKRSVLTVLDCGVMKSGGKFQRFFFKWLWLKLPVWKACHVTTISEASRQDILKYTGCNPLKVTVIPVAVSQIFQPSEKLFNENHPVFLQIGTAPNKNLERLFEAIHGIPCTLVIIGVLDDRLRQLLDKWQIRYENKFNLTTAQIYEQYVRCDLVTFISTFEGFGMPIIEANWVERPVIAGNNSSMIDVAGNAAFLVDAYSVADIRRGIERILSDRQLRGRLIEEGRVNRERFSAARIANMYYELYLEIAGNK